MTARLAALSLVVASVCNAQTTQKPAFVSGRVVDINGVPLAEARVRMLSAAAQTQVITASSGFTAVTGVDGAFVFEDVPPDRYTLRAERSGYIGSRYQAPVEVGINFELKADQRLTGATIRMTPEASISGRVTNANDEPVAQTRIGVYQWTYQAGKRLLTRTRNPTTGTDGRFAADGLASGTYYVSAELSESAVTYYPNASQPIAASPIVLAAGGSFSNANIRMRDDPLFHVRGRVTDALTGAAPSQNRIVFYFYPAAPELDVRPLIRYPQQTPAGEFDIDRVAAGQYFLRIQQVPGGIAAQIEITVKDRDIDDLIVPVRPGVQITARITMEASDSQPSITRPQTLYLPSVNPAFGGETGVAQADGTYLFSNVGPWTLQPLAGIGMPAGMYIKSVRFGGETLTDSEHRFTSGGNMDVTISTHAAEVSGILKDREGKPLAGVTLSLWRSGAMPPAMFFATQDTRTDANGTFRIQNVPPGDYRIAAWEEIPQGADLVPEFRVQFDSGAKAVRLAEDARETVEPVFIRRAAIEDAIARLR